jgi:hypothetical protein
VDFDPGKQPEAPDHITVKKGETARYEQYTLIFQGFEIPKAMGEGGLHSMKVGAKIEASYQGQEPVTLTPILDVGQLSSPDSRVKLPGPQEAFVTFARIDAGSKTVSLIYDGPKSDAQAHEEPKESGAVVIAEVSIKPGMTLLWVGTFLMLFGGTVGVIRRWS